MYKEIMERKLKERDEKINKNIRFYHKKLNNSNGYKLYDVELGDSLTYEPICESENIINNVNDKAVKRNLHADQKRTKKRKNNSSRHMSKSKKKKKGIIATITALVLAGVMTVSGFLIASKLKKKDNNVPSNSTSTSQKTDDLVTGSLDLLGEELPKDDKKTEYTKVSGDFNIEDVVRGADGVLYDSEESARNASKSGSVEIDTKGGSLVVSDNGKVYTKEEGYEIVDEQGNVVESGTGTPSSGESGIDYVECPYDYYDDEGNLVHSVGEFITPQELEKCEQYYHTTKPEKDEYTTVEEEIIYFDEEIATIGSEETTKEEIKEEVVEEDTTYEEETTTSYSESGVVNPDGTYTIYGVTYASYADYQQYVFNNGEGYGYIDGIIQSIGDYEIEYQYTK